MEEAGTEVGGMAATDGMAAHGLGLASASGHSGGRIGEDTGDPMPIAILMPTPMAIPMPMRTRRWSPPHRPSSLSNLHPRLQSSRLPSIGTIVTRPRATTRMSTNAQGDGGR